MTSDPGQDAGAFPSAGRSSSRTSSAQASAAAAAILLTALSTAQAATRNFQNYGRAQGIPQSQVVTLAQDGQGYLWIGTFGGLARYNGHRFTSYTVSDGLVSNAIETLAPGPDGDLIVGTQAGYCRFQGDRFDCTGPNDGFPATSVFAALYQDEVLWLGTDQGLIRVIDGKRRMFGPDDGLPGNEVHALHLDPDDGSLWIGTSNGIARLLEGQIEVMWPETFNATSVQMMLSTGDGRYIGTNAGLYLVDGAEIRRVDPATSRGAASFYDGIEGPEGDFWFGTNQGVLRLSGRNVEWIHRKDGLLADEVHRLLVDREETIWFGTDDGLSKLTLSPFTAYTERHGLSHPFVRSVEEDLQGRMWLGTKQGVSIFEDERVSTLELPEPFDSMKVYSLVHTSDGGMLIGLASGLLWWRDGAVQKVYSTGDGLPSTYVAAMDRSDGAIWLGTRSGLARWRDGEIERYPVSDAVDDAFVLTILHDARGRLWLGLASGGVIMVDGDQVRRFSAANGLSDHTIWGLSESDNGDIWVGTNGDGAFRIRDGDIQQFNRSSGLASNIIWQVLADSRGKVWLYTNDGLDCLRDGRITNYGRSSGLLSFEGSTNAAIEHSSGDLYFGTGRGLIQYRRDARQPVSQPPPVVIEDVYRAGAGAVQSDETLSHDFRQISFEFAALSYRAESALRYRYRLKGLADEWSAPIRRPNVSYGHLPPKKYEFEVIAQNDTGRWSEVPARFAFSVGAPIWQTWWFWLGASFTAILLAVFAASWRLRSLHAIRQQLESEVRERTLELKRTNDKLRALSITDELTGLYNRRHLYQSLDRELGRLSRRAPGAPLSFMLIDLDHFKRVNDEHGHLFGDRVLEEAADRIRAITRRSDILARYGGEEFAIILPETRLEGARTVAEKVVLAFSNQPFEIDSKPPFTLTVSAGISQCLQQDARDNPETAMESLVHAADAALYKAKQNGRDRVEVEDPGHPGRTERSQ